MVMAFTAEQEELRRVLRRFLRARASSAQVRRLMETETGYDPSVWSEMAQLGLQGMAIPEEYGGAGFGQVELTVVFEELGRALLPAPYFATVLATHALLLSEDDGAKRDLLPDIARGATVATFAIAEDAGRWDFAHVATNATRATDGGWTLDGRKVFVLDGHTADLILVAAQAPGGPSVFAVRGDAAGLTRRAQQTMDMTRKQAEVVLTGTPARLIGADGTGEELLRRTLDLAIVALAAEQVGGAQQCLDTSVDYAKLRVQFGRPIGGFQAIKHKCADMLLAVESARSAAYYAGFAAAEGSDELPVAAALAKAYCSEAYVHAAAESIQIHGGIGFTWEHDAHLYFRRAKSSELLFGDAVEYRERIAALLL